MHSESSIIVICYTCVHFHFQAKVNIPAKLLIEKIKDSDSITSWNKTLLKSETLKKINDTVGITYQVNIKTSYIAMAMDGDVVLLII